MDKARLRVKSLESTFEFQCQSIKREKMPPNNPYCQHDQGDEGDIDDDDDDDNDDDYDQDNHGDNYDDTTPFHKHFVS